MTTTPNFTPDMLPWAAYRECAKLARSGRRAIIKADRLLEMANDWQREAPGDEDELRLRQWARDAKEESARLFARAQDRTEKIRAICAEHGVDLHKFLAATR